MAFNYSTVSPTLVEVVGSFTRIMTGRTTLSSGSATVTLPSQYRIKLSAAWSNSSTNVAYASAETTNTITITGNGSDTVTWIALVDGGM